MTEHVDIWFETVDLSTTVREKLWLLISDKIEYVLDEFYETLLRSDHKHLLDGIDLERLRGSQKQYWRMLIMHGVDDDYDRRVNVMHLRHKAIGLDNRQFIMAYIYFMNRFQEVILRASPGPNEAHKLISALQTIIADDIARALDAYYKPVLQDLGGGADKSDAR